jgi:nitroreductase
MNTIECIKSRASVRSFRKDEIPEKDIKDILDAAVRAPSAGNVQDWEFIVVGNPELKAKLATAAFQQEYVAKAPVVIVICSDLRAIGNAYGERGTNLYSIQDTAAATQNLILAAWEKGLGCCWVGSFNESAVKEALVLPGHVKPMAIIPVGYPQSKPSPSGRKNIDNAIHRDYY